MSKAHKGFVSDSGVQSHSAGDLFPYSIVCIGGFPAENNDAYCEVWGPDGRKDGPFDTHARAEEWASFLKRRGAAADFSVRKPHCPTGLGEILEAIRQERKVKGR